MQLKHIFLALMLLTSAFVFGQGACIPGQAITSRSGFNNLAAVVPGATVTVSPGPIYLDQTLSTVIAGNTITADAYGNYNICASSGTQTVSVNGPNMQTLTYKLTFPINPGATIYCCVAMYTSAGVLSNLTFKVIEFTATLSGGSANVTLTGAGVFPTTPWCFANDITANNVSNATGTAPNSVTVLGTGSDVIHVMCVNPPGLF